MEQYLVHVREKGVYKVYSHIAADEWITCFILTYNNNEKCCTAYLTLNLDSRPVKPATSTNDSVKNYDNIWVTCNSNITEYVYSLTWKIANAPAKTLRLTFNEFSFVIW